MDKEPLQYTLFEPSMTETVEVTELYGNEPGGIFDFIGADWKPTTIETCWGDLRVMVDVLEDYANILERVVTEWNLEGYRAYTYELHAARCRKIAKKYASAIGYDREKTLKKCKKFKSDPKDDTGEEALMLLAKYGTGKPKGAPGGEEASAPAGQTPEEPQEAAEQLLLTDVEGM